MAWSDVRRGHRIGIGVGFALVALLAASGRPEGVAPGGGRPTGSEQSTTAHLHLAATTTSPTVVAAGDISPRVITTQKATSDLVLRLAPTRVLALGDEQYNSGALADFRAFYAPTWGRFKGSTLPTPGNHEYNTPGASGYFQYFGSQAGPNGRSYYSRDLGGWHLISLDSNIARTSGSPQLTWLRADLAATQKRCVLAFWHHPRFGSGADHGNNPSVTPFWTALYRAHADIVLNAINGSVGLRPTLAALDAGATLALANKESLIMGGDLVLSRAKPGQIVPVDSEHSALAQCLRGGRADEVSRLVLTASGGPFRGRSREDLRDVTPSEALSHPTWDMGPVITTNSATLVNKGLEVIEAHLLFGVDYDRIDVVVHPQSIVHSMVEFGDGSTIAQASPPDMHLPISLALAWPERLAGAAIPLRWDTAQTWAFEPVDHAAFPALQLAVEAGRRAGLAPAVYNAANEVCVEAFLAGGLSFLGIVDTVAAVLTASDVPSVTGDVSVDDVVAADRWARDRAAEAVAREPNAGGAPHR